MRAIEARTTRRGPSRSISAPKSGWPPALTSRLAVAARASVERSTPSSPRIGLNRIPNAKFTPVATRRTVNPAQRAGHAPGARAPAPEPVNARRGSAVVPRGGRSGAPGGARPGAPGGARPGAPGKGRPATGGGSPAGVLPLGAGRERDPVARPLRDPDQAVGGVRARHVDEEVGRGPVHVLDEEPVRQGAGDVERELVHDVRGDQELVRR